MRCKEPSLSCKGPSLRSHATMDWRHSHSEYLCLTKTRVDIRTQAKKEEPTLESKARMQGGPVEIQLGSENRSFGDDYFYPYHSEAYTRTDMRTQPKLMPHRNLCLTGTSNPPPLCKTETCAIRLPKLLQLTDRVSQRLEAYVCSNKHIH